MWELAERAWSRAESRHDLTMEAVRVSQARAALGESPAPARAATATYPRRAPLRAEPVRDGAGPAPEEPSPGGPSPGGPSPGRPSPGGPSGGGAPVGPSAPGPERGGAALSGARPPGPPRAGAPSRGRRRVTLLLAGVTGALLVLGAVLFLPRLFTKDEANRRAEPTSSASARAAELPAGVRCAGTGCGGKDPEAMGCGGELARTTDRATVGSRLVEVRYSEVCGAAWARITQAGPGDTVTARVGGHAQRATVEDTGDAYTRMLSVPAPGRARACAEVAA
ncbi:conserved hypothetical protein, partial [Streptomyces sp. SPB074]